MTAFWRFGDDLTSMLYLGRLMDKRPPAYGVSLNAHLQPSWDRVQTDNGRDGDVLPLTGDEWQVPILRIRDPAFPLDYVSQSGYFVSAFARDVLRPAEPYLQYLSVDCSPSSPVVVEKHFLAVRYLARRKVFDVPTPGSKSRRVRGDAPTDAPIFVPEGGGHTYVTDGFARHLLNSGLKGFSLTDDETGEVISVPISSEVS
jgi:hypothetical protein